MQDEPIQLLLIDSGDRVEWRLDERTREAGRRGVAEAREALRHATRRTAA